jgi:hypothetical protein
MSIYFGVFMKKVILFTILSYSSFAFSETCPNNINVNTQIVIKDPNLNLNRTPNLSYSIPYQNGIIMIGYNKIDFPEIHEYRSEGLICFYDKNGNIEENKEQTIIIDLKRTEIINGLIDKQGKNLVFLGYSESDGGFINPNLPIYLPNFQHNSVFIGKLELETGKIISIRHLEENSITKPFYDLNKKSSLRNTKEGGFRVIYDTQKNKEGYDSFAKQELKNTDLTKVVKLDQDLNKLGERIIKNNQIVGL